MNEKHYKADLKKLSKSKFIKLLKQSVESTPKPSIKQMVRDSDITADDKLFSTTKRPILKPRGSVKQMVQEYKITSSLHHLSLEMGTNQFQHQRKRGRL